MEYLTSLPSFYRQKRTNIFLEKQAETHCRNIDSVKAEFQIKVNFNYTCKEFYEIILKNKDTLKCIETANKYYILDKNWLLRKLNFVLEGNGNAG